MQIADVFRFLSLQHRLIFSTSCSLGFSSLSVPLPRPLVLFCDGSPHCSQFGSIRLLRKATSWIIHSSKGVSRELIGNFQNSSDNRFMDIFWPTFYHVALQILTCSSRAGEVRFVQRNRPEPNTLFERLHQRKLFTLAYIWTKPVQIQSRWYT